MVDWIPWKVVSSLSVALFKHRLENLFLRVPWTVRRSNQSILKEINPEYPLEGLMLKLKLQCFDHLMQRADSLEKTLMLGKIEGRRKRENRGWDGWMASSTQWTWVWASSGRWWRTGKSGVLQSMGSLRVGHNLATEQQQHYYYEVKMKQYVYGVYNVYVWAAQLWTTTTPWNIAHQTPLSMEFSRQEC